MGSKYRACRVKEDGFTFDSKAEHRRYCELRLLLRIGKIEVLSVHPRWPITINGVKICTVEMDFSYFERATELIVEDVKGMDLPISKLKRKLLTALYPELNIRILTAK